MMSPKQKWNQQLIISRVPKMCAILQLDSAPSNPRPIVDHFRRSHQLCEHSYWTNSTQLNSIQAMHLNQRHATQLRPCNSTKDMQLNSTQAMQINWCNNW